MIKLTSILRRPSSLRGDRGASQSQPAIAGTLLREAPLHLAAVSIDLDDDTVVCSCDYGCDDCDPEPTLVRTQAWRAR